MPWDNNSGNNQNPWGSGGGSNRGSGRGNGGGGPRKGPGNEPDIEEIIRQAQQRFGRLLPSAGGGSGLVVILAVLLGLWALSGFYRVQADEQGVVLRFGKFHTQTSPGLNYHLPFPIETAVTPKVTTENLVDIGMRAGGDRRSAGVTRDVPEESLMLTGDENIVDVDFSVFWVIKDAPDYLFNIQNPNGTVKAVAESTMREIIGQNDIQPILTEQRQTNEEQVKALMQKTLDQYGAGITVTRVKMQKVDPPAAVIDAFRDVQAAEQERDQRERQADAYANQRLAEARGAAAQLLEAAEGYRASVVNAALGEASQFSAVLTEYKEAPEVTRRRLYIETLEKVLSDVDKIIMDNGEGGQGVVPYLPLNELRKSSQGGSN